MSVPPHRVLFVCLGNICRSPLAEAVFLNQAAAKGHSECVAADSCGTGHWHVGELPDPRARDVARKHGIKLVHRARQLDPAQDLAAFDRFVAMDRQNLGDLLRLGFPRDRTALLRSFEAGADSPDVPDPYYGGPEGFEDVYHLLIRACEGLLARVVELR